MPTWSLQLHFPAGDISFLCQCLVGSAAGQTPPSPSSTRPTAIWSPGGYELSHPVGLQCLWPLVPPASLNSPVLRSSPEAWPGFPAMSPLPPTARAQGYTEACVRGMHIRGVHGCVHVCAPLHPPLGDLHH